MYFTCHLSRGLWFSSTAFGGIWCYWRVIFSWQPCTLVPTRLVMKKKSFLLYSTWHFWQVLRSLPVDPAPLHFLIFLHDSMTFCWHKFVPYDHSLGIFVEIVLWDFLLDMLDRSCNPWLAGWLPSQPRHLQLSVSLQDCSALLSAADFCRSGNLRCKHYLKKKIFSCKVVMFDIFSHLK